MDKQDAFRFDNKMNYDLMHREPGRVQVSEALATVEQEDLVRKLLEEDPAYLFKHALTQDAAYSTLMKQQRKRLHLIVAETLEQVYAGRMDEFASPLAQHYAEGGDLARAVNCYIRAGEVSARVFAANEARGNYSAALAILQELPESPGTIRAQFETMVKLAAFTLGTDDSAELFQRLLVTEEQGKRLLGENNPADRLNLARLRYEIARVFFTLNQPFKAFEYCELMREDAEALGDQGLYDLAMGLKGVGLLDQGYFEQAIRALPAAVTNFEQNRNWREWAWMNMNLAFALAEHGEYRAALDIGARVSERAEKFQDYWMDCVSALYHAIIFWAGGDIPESLARARSVMRLAVEGNELVFLGLGSLPQMWAESKLGDFAAAAQTLALRQAGIEQAGVEIVWADWGAAARAEMALNAGEFDRAMMQAQEAVQVARSVGGIFAEGLAQRTWAEAVAAQSHDSAATVQEHLAASLDLFERGGARLEAARTRLVWGKWLVARREPSGASDLLARAAAQFQASGLERELAETNALMP